MIIKEKSKDIYNFLSGKKYLDKKVDDYSELAPMIFRGSKPVFVLSTGRCGTIL